MESGNRLRTEMGTLYNITSSTFHLNTVVTELSLKLKDMGQNLPMKGVLKIVNVCKQPYYLSLLNLPIYCCLYVL